MKLAAVLWIPLLTLSPSGQDVLSDATLKDLKRATVFIKVSGEKVGTTASGFLFRSDNDNGYVATNAHVVNAVPDDSHRKVTVVFSSGTKEERSVEAAPVLVDPEHDLAVLTVRGKDLPKPIEPVASSSLRETLTTYI